MFDSGVRSAADVFKALAIGAKFVFVGRIWIWGLSIMGEHGVNRVYLFNVHLTHTQPGPACDEGAFERV
jgi:hypothetical protein